MQIAIVDDEQVFIDDLTELIERFFKENGGEPYNIESFTSSAK